MRGKHGERHGGSLTYLRTLIVHVFGVQIKPPGILFGVNCSTASVMAPSSTPPNEKAEVFQAETAPNHGHVKGQVGRIGAMATAPGTTLESFSHLDEKKILRKVYPILEGKIALANTC